MKRLRRPLERLLLTVWVGSLWAVGYLAVPVFFANLDTGTAGMLAGKLFTLVSYIGLVCGAVLILLRGSGYGSRVADWKLGVLVVMLVLVIIGEMIVQPMMADLKAPGLVEGSRQAAEFGRLHGIASILYLLESLGGGVLVASGLEPAGPHKAANQ